MADYNYKMENALKKAVEQNKTRIDLSSRVNAENTIWFVHDLLEAYGDTETAMRIRGLANAVDNLDTNILVKSGIFQ